MGFLGVGEPISWEDLSDDIKLKVRQDGLAQLVHIWSLNEGRQDSSLYWGDEQEFTMVHFDHAKQQAKVVLEAPRVLQTLKEREEAANWDAKMVCCKRLFLNKPKATFLRGSEWHPEFGNHMIEATPSPPYPMSIEGLLDIEESMLSRRLKLQQVLTDLYDDVYATSLTVLPNYGITAAKSPTDATRVADYIYQGENKALVSDAELTDFFDGSVSVIAKVPNPHPRFGSLVRNVNARRGTKISGLFPIAYRSADDIWSDSLGEIPEHREQISKQSQLTPHPVRGYAYADSFAHGMSMCCLQVTFGSHTVSDSLYLYDQMVVLAPIFLALSAATPNLFGHVSGLDTRWKVLEQTCDCRTEAELKQIPQSRYGCAPMFISDDAVLSANESALNDVLLPYDQASLEYLRSAARPQPGASSGLRWMSERVMRHFATLWLRDPLVIFSDKIDLDNTCSSDHFENIQSTNWNTVRFKPPPPSADGRTLSPIGWRVELRTPDLQLSDFQNAALAGIASVLAMAIQREHWNLYIPISQVRENLELASNVDACVGEKFWWPIFEKPTADQEGPQRPTLRTERRSLRSIFTDENFGLLNRLDRFVSSEWREQRCSCDAVEQYRIYAAFIRNRVSGSKATNARVLRNFTGYSLKQAECVPASPASTIDVTPLRGQGANALDRYNTGAERTPDSVSEAGAPTDDDCALPRINHQVNYKVVKYSVLAGYVRDVQLELRDVHSSRRSAQSATHICSKSSLLQGLKKLLPGEFALDLPDVIVLPTAQPISSERPAPCAHSRDHKICSSCCL